MRQHVLVVSTTYLGAPGKGDEGEVPVISHGFSDVCSSTDCRTDGWRNQVSSKHLLNYLADCYGDEGRGRSALPEGAVATDQTEALVPTKHSYREVEGGDDPHHTKRVPLLQQGMAGS